MKMLQQKSNRIVTINHYMMTMFYHGGINMNNTKRSIISILSVIMLVGIIAGLVPSKNVNAAGPYLSKKMTITNSVNANLTGKDRPTIFNDDKIKHEIKGRISGLKGNETVCVSIEAVTKNGYNGATSIIDAKGRTYIDFSKTVENTWGIIWCGEYYVTVTVNGSQVGETFYFSVIRRSTANYIKDLNGFVGRQVSGICTDAFNICIGKTTPAAVARKYFKTQAFKLKANSLSNEEYVKNLYKAVLGRDPDAEGLKFWINYLIKSGQTKERVLECFLDSEEFKNRTI